MVRREVHAPDPAPLGSLLEERERLLNECGMVLEDAAVPGVGENAQLCIRQPAGEFEGVERRHHHVVIAIDDQDGMLNRRELRGIALSPGLDRRKLSLNGFVADGRIKVLGAFFQALQEAVGGSLTVARLCKEQKMFRMLVGGAGLAKRVLQNGADIGDAFAAGRAGARENDFADQTGLLLRDSLRDETAEREAQQIDFAEAERAYERDGIPSISSTVLGVEPPEPPTPRLSNTITWCFAARPSTTRGSQSSNTAVRWWRSTTGMPPFLPISR